MTKKTATSPQSTVRNETKSDKGPSTTKVKTKAKTKAKKSDATEGRTEALPRSSANNVHAQRPKRDATPRRAQQSATHIDDDVIAGGEELKPGSQTTARKDPSDRARDRRLGAELEQAGVGRSAQDRHRERLTAVEATEDGVSEDEDDSDEDKKMRDPVLAQETEDETDLDQEPK